MTCENSLATERADQRKWDPSLTYLIWFQNTKDGDGENAHHRPMDNVMVAKSTAAVVFMTLATYFELHQLCILYIEETSTQISWLDSTGAQSSRSLSTFPRLLYECLPTWAVDLTPWEGEMSVDMWFRGKKWVGVKRALLWENTWKG